MALQCCRAARGAFWVSTLGDYEVNALHQQVVNFAPFGEGYFAQALIGRAGNIDAGVLHIGTAGARFGWRGLRSGNFDAFTTLCRSRRR
jgi:hypothetical protein